MDGMLLGVLVLPGAAVAPVADIAATAPGNVVVVAVAAGGAGVAWPGGIPAVPDATAGWPPIRFRAPAANALAADARPLAEPAAAAATAAAAAAAAADVGAVDRPAAVAVGAEAGAVAADAAPAMEVVVVAVAVALAVTAEAAVAAAEQLLFELDGEASDDGGGVGSAAGCSSDDTLGGCGVFADIIGPFELRLGDGDGTGISEEPLLVPSASRPLPEPELPVGVGGMRGFEAPTPPAVVLLQLLAPAVLALVCGGCWLELSWPMDGGAVVLLMPLLLLLPNGDGACGMTLFGGCCCCCWPGNSCAATAPLAVAVPAVARRFFISSAIWEVLSCD